MTEKNLQNVCTADEESLLQRAQVYDPEALGELYDRYAPLVFSYLFRRVHDAQTAEDLTADVFLSVLEAIQSDKFWHTSFKGWLYRIAGNKVVDYYRAQSKEHTVFVENHLVPESESPDKALMQKQSMTALQNAITDLTVNQQEVLILRYGQRLKSREVAEILGKSVGAVEALQNRALNTLRKMLDKRISSPP